MTRWYRRPRGVIGLSFLAAGVAATLVWTLSPWPAALLIRGMFEKGAADTVAEMLPYVPERYVEQRDVPVGNGQLLDVFSDPGIDGALPTVVWIHGGAWISGDKSNVEPYLKILASEGFTTVSLNYTVSPEAQYPTALTQLNDALTYLVEHAVGLRIDPSRIVLAGDSAGANLASQLAVVTTNPDYAAELGIQPALTPEQLRGVVLNCGIYDVSGIPNAPGIAGWGFRVALWAYLGEKDWSNTAGGQEMSTLDYVTADFPRTWISGGNGDPLTPSQSKPLADKLDGLGVEVEPVFYPDDHDPELPHEYQFHLDFAAAQDALASTIGFLRSVTAE